MLLPIGDILVDDLVKCSYGGNWLIRIDAPDDPMDRFHQIVWPTECADDQVIETLPLRECPSVVEAGPDGRLMTVFPYVFDDANDR